MVNLFFPIMLDIRNVKIIFFSSSDDERCNVTGPGTRKVVLVMGRPKMRVLSYLLK